MTEAPTFPAWHRGPFPNSWLVRVSLPQATFGLEVRQGLVYSKGSAPYGMAMLWRKRIGRGKAAVRYFRSLGAEVQWWRLDK